MNVACIVCLAKSNKPCVNEVGQVTTTHFERFEDEIYFLQQPKVVEAIHLLIKEGLANA